MTANALSVRVLKDASTVIIVGERAETDFWDVGKTALILCGGLG